jgi:hypothetical protein
MPIEPFVFVPIPDTGSTVFLILMAVVGLIALFVAENLPK